MILTCPTCQKEFKVRQSYAARCKAEALYCSMACRFPKRIKTCLGCGRDFKVRNREQQQYCNGKCRNKHSGGRHDPAKGYTEPRKNRELLIQLRGPRCETCGYDDCPEILTPHHIVLKMDGGTNQLENLKLLCQNCHAILHLRTGTRGGASRYRPKVARPKLQPKYSQEVQDEAVKMVMKGIPVSKVASELGMARNTVYYWVTNRDLEIPAKAQGRKA